MIGGVDEVAARLEARRREANARMSRAYGEWRTKRNPWRNSVVALGYPVGSRRRAYPVLPPGPDPEQEREALPPRLRQVVDEAELHGYCKWRE
jgi:hypothetical protein